jgi:serine/threonine protein kinase
MKVEELGKGAYGYVDRVVSTVSHKEYAQKLVPRGRIFKPNHKILRDFERELGTQKYCATTGTLCSSLAAILTHGS